MKTFKLCIITGVNVQVFHRSMINPTITEVFRNTLGQSNEDKEVGTSSTDHP